MFGKFKKNQQNSCQDLWFNIRTITVVRWLKDTDFLSSFLFTKTNLYVWGGEEEPIISMYFFSRHHGRRFKIMRTNCYSALFIQLFFYFLFLAALWGMQDFSSVTRHQIHCPLQWKYGVLTTGLPGNSTAMCLWSPWQRDLPAHQSIPSSGLLTTFFPFYFYQCVFPFIVIKIHQMENLSSDPF